MPIRSCRLSDAPAVAALATELGYTTTADQAAERLGVLLQRPDHAIFAAEDSAGAMVGLAHVHEAHEVVESQPVAELAGLIVAQSARGGGFGRALVEAVSAWGAARGLAILRVHSNVVREEAHRWYQAAGFAIVKTQRVFQRPTRPAGGDGTPRPSE